MNNYPEDRIGLVIKSADSIAKCISIIRKYNPISISEIKTAIESKAFVFDCDYTNDSAVRKIRRCYDELVKTGATVEIYEDGDLTTREFISNLLNTYREIDQEIQNQIDAEVATEGGDEE
ncbi:MAG: hypothetical protein IKD90_07660 [Clostridiales bacterium]|nr:hypothetical protein [Clostridiales bacterium]